LVQDLDVVAAETLGGALVLALGADRAPDANGAPEEHRAAELPLLEAHERRGGDPGLHLADLEAGGDREHEHAVGHPLAEDRVPCGHGVHVEPVEVAREPREVDHVRLGDGATPRDGDVSLGQLFPHKALIGHPASPGSWLAARGSSPPYRAGPAWPLRPRPPSTTPPGPP